MQPAATERSLWREGRLVLTMRGAQPYRRHVDMDLVRCKQINPHETSLAIDLGDDVLILTLSNSSAHALAARLDRAATTGV